MAEQITLRAYTERIEDMLRKGRTEEAVAHATHVLEAYPKNAAIYRNLGRALVRLQRYDEAGDVFRRLLTALPDDFSAHYQLSIIYEQAGRGDAALWHVERAFDQDPNSQQVAERLRTLYKTFRDVDVDKIQLTAGAVAKQYIRAGMPARAVDVLRKTLRKMPDRTDLRLLLATALWNNGNLIDAAEQAVDVLKTNPFAVEANRIMTELWLSEDRPSDAQRYLSRLEDIDPYLAYEIALDSDDVPDEQLMLEALDFARYQATLASQEDIPDWLSSVDEVAVADTSVEDSADLLGDDTDFGDDDDWLAEIDDMGSSQPITEGDVKKVTDDLSGLLPDDFDFPDSAGTDDTVSDADMADLPESSTGMTDLLDSLDADGTDDVLEGDAESTGMTDLLGALDGEGNTPEAMDALLDVLEDEDVDAIEGTGMTDLLGELGVDTGDLISADEDDSEVIEGTGMTDLLGALEDDGISESSQGLLDILETQDEANASTEDDLSWLDDVSSGQYDLNESTTPFDDDDEVDDDFFAELEAEESIEVDSQDPMAWLEESDAEVFDDHVEPTNELNAPDGEDATTDDVVNPDDPMAWLQESGIEYEETDGEASPFVLEDEPSSFESNDVDPMAWLGEDDDSVLPEDDAIEADAVLEDDPMAWLGEEGVELLDDEADIYAETNALDDSETEGADDEAMMAWLTPGADTGDFPDVDTNNLVTGDLGEPDADALAGVEFLDEDDFDTFDDAIEVNDEDWLSDDEVLEDLLNIADLTNTDEQAVLDTDDLLFTDTDMQDAMPMNEQQSWTPDDDFDADDGMASEQDDDPMAWLQEEDVAFDNFDMDAEESDPVSEMDQGDDPMAWLQESGVELVDGDDGTALADEDYDTMDWSPEDEMDAEGEDFSFDALDDDNEINDTDDDFAPAEPQVTGMLDFLSDDAGDADDDFDFDFEIEDSGDEADWLQALDGTDTDDSDPAPVSELDDADAEDGDWNWGADTGESGDAFGDDAFDSAEDLDWTLDESDAVAAEADWLTGLDAPDDADSDDDFDNFGDFSDDAADESDAVAAEGDWLADLDISDESDDNDFDDFTSFDDFDEDDVLDDDEEMAEPMGEDWLSELGIPDDDSADDDFGDFGDESDAVAAEGDWLADIEMADEGDDDDFGDDFDDFTGFDDFDEDDDEALAEPAGADWLSELGAPDDDNADDDFGDFGDESDAVAAEGDWLADIEMADEGDDDDFGDDFDDFTGFDDFDEDDDTLDDDEALAEPAGADWLNELGAPDDDSADDDFGDFDTFDDFGDDESEDDLAVAEGDWLADLEPEDASPIEAEAEAFDSFDDFHDDDAIADPAGADWLNELDGAPDDTLDDDFGGDDDPAWLSELDGGDMVDDDSFDDFDADDEMADAVAADADWLNELDGEDLVEDAPVAEAETDWGDIPETGFTDELDDFGDDGDDWGELPETGFTDELDDFDDGGDWGELPETGFTSELDASEVEGTDWGDLPETGFTDELDDFANDEGQDSDDVAALAEDDWLADVAVEEEDMWDGEDDAVFGDYDEDVDFEEPAVTGMTGMLNSIRANQDDDVTENDMVSELDDTIADRVGMDDDGEDDLLDDFDEFVEFDAFDAEAVDEPDWTDGFDAAEDDFEEDVADQEAIPFAEQDRLDDDADEIPEFVAASAGTVIPDDYDEETEQSDAENAPDWLNAMVPGLDLDFEAEDEGHLDEGFDERDATLRGRTTNESETINTDFDWLRDIVEEESGYMDSVVDEDMAGTTPPPVPMPQRKVYAFDQLPPWARDADSGDVAMADVPAMAADDTPDYLSDFEDFDDFDESLDYDEFDDAAFADDAFEFDDDDEFDDFDEFDESFDDDDEFDDADFK